MRRLIWLVLVAAVLWGGYWFAGATVLERGVRDWLADAPPVQAASADVAGFPSRFDLTLTDLRAGDAAMGQAVWQAPFVQLFALSYKPWHLIAALPPEQTLTLPDGTVLQFTAEKLQASLVVTPSTDVALDRTAVAGSGLVLRAQDRPGVALGSLQFNTRRDPSRTDTHEIWMGLTGLRPDPGLITPLPDRPLPTGDATLHVDAFLGLTAPLDRFAGQTRPVPRLIELRELRFSWGDIRVEASGQLVPDAMGLAQGQIDLRLSGWTSALDVAVATGLMRPGIAATWGELARRLAETSPTPGQLDLPLVLADGRMRLGPVPMGLAPRLIP
jgi:hypothetical protein